MSENITKPVGLDLMRMPFPEHQISLLPKPFKKDSPKGKCTDCGGYHGLPAVHLKYVGHAALTDRLLDADPAWVWEPLHIKDGLPDFDLTGGLWIKLTVCGVTRLGYGNAALSSYSDIGSREKEVIGDALRNAAMRFGAALELWHKGDLHLNEDAEASNTSPQPQGSLKNHAPVSNAQSAQKAAEALRDKAHAEIKARVEPESDEWSPGDYCMPFGPTKGVQLKCLTVNEVKGAVKWAKEKGKFKELVEYGQQYVDLVEAKAKAQDMNIPFPSQDDEIPF